MKNLQLVLSVALVAFISASPFESTRLTSHKDPECIKGITFWCQNVINAKKCNAVNFCIGAVWESHLIQQDSDAVCDDCKEWVDRARTFIANNQTSDDVIGSLKWTCDLIPINSLMTPCEKLVDDNIPEILKMMESSMKSDAICSKMLFCNNAEYDNALQAVSVSTQKVLPFTCGQCHHVGSIIEKKFIEAGRNEVLEKLLTGCGEMSSFSDACFSIVKMHFDDIYVTMTKTIKKENLCSSSGACSYQQHVKEGIVDIIPAGVGPNIPCELCEQLVLHLRELLIANTTEIEFKNILTGFCHQFGQFSSECINIADQYSDIIFQFLVDKLNANKACILIEICPSQDGFGSSLIVPKMPLVSIEVGADSSLTLVKNGTWCTTCDYFVHFLQEALRKQSNEDKITEIMKKTCLELPKKIQSECVALVELYGDTMFSLLDMNMNPSYICPKLKLCPPNTSLEYLKETAVDEKPTCPFCLMALQEIRDVIESNVTKQNIENVLGKLCAHLSDKLMSQCTEFVKQYSDQVVDMILADFTPQEACTFIKLCTDDKVELKNVKIVASEDFVDEMEREMITNPQCELCKEIVKIVEQRVINKKSKDEIRRELEKSCSRLKKFSDKCTKFVDKYSDLIVDLIEKELEPEEVCHELIFCVSIDDAESQDYDAGLDIFMLATNAVDEDIKEQPQCVLCEFIMTKLDGELNDKKTDAEIKTALRNICIKMPSTVAKPCKQFIDYYFDMIIVFIETVAPSEVCAEMKLCPAQSFDEIMMIEKIQDDVYKCAICKGFVEGLNSVIEDPYTDVHLTNLVEKLCEKFAGKYRQKCHDIADESGTAILSLMKTLTDSDQVCYKLDLCSSSSDNGVTGMLKLT